MHALHTALILEGPVSLRYPRGEAEGAPLPDVPEMCIRDSDLDLLFEISEYWEEMRKRGHYKRGVSSLIHMQVYSHQVLSLIHI